VDGRPKLRFCDVLVWMVGLSSVFVTDIMWMVDLSSVFVTDIVWMVAGLS